MAQKFWNKNEDENWTKKERAYLESGHVWIEEDGIINIFANDAGTHNGPTCTLCGYAPCWHCEPVPKPCPSND